MNLDYTDMYSIVRRLLNRNGLSCSIAWDQSAKFAMRYNPQSVTIKINPMRMQHYIEMFSDKIPPEDVVELIASHEIGHHIDFIRNGSDKRISVYKREFNAWQYGTEIVSPKLASEFAKLNEMNMRKYSKVSA